MKTQCKNVAVELVDADKQGESNEKFYSNELR